MSKFIITKTTINDYDIFTRLLEEFGFVIDQTTDSEYIIVGSNLKIRSLQLRLGVGIKRYGYTKEPIIGPSFIPHE